jgi:glycogen phosphorylase
MHELLDLIPTGPGAPIRVPTRVKGLHDLAFNVWWSWDPDAVELWSKIDPARWRSNENPIDLLREVDAATFEELLEDAAFTALYDDVMQRFTSYMTGNHTWYDATHAGELDGPIAYLCAEFGMHHKLRLYSGGLGILAGDHLKAVSDLGVPLVAIGLMYRMGYFMQTVDPDGNQQHVFSSMEPARRPMRPVIDPTTKHPLEIEVALDGSTVRVAAWRIDVGRVPLLLLDTDLPGNDPADRPITDALYTRGRELRLCQEILLGVGGVRILAALGIEPAVWHVNEGHAATSVLERLRVARLGGSTDDGSIASVKAKTVFTLHTPVPAGNEVFELDLVKRHLGEALPELAPDEVADLGGPQSGRNDWFDMGALAIRLSRQTNGVSQRHAEVVTGDWEQLIGGPAVGITNGVHAPTWVGPSIGRLFRKLVGEHWDEHAADPSMWKAMLDVPDDLLWNAHLSQKEHMVRQLRNRLRTARARHGASPNELRTIETELPVERLTLVFARRMATYKRAGLLFSDLARARALLTDGDRPVQIVFAGKAHPADREGQGLIRSIVEMSNVAELSGHVFFIENYDMALGALLAQGADVWLNNPRPPQEASGTSGMKAAMNGCLNLSVLDGWWIEGYADGNGWGFGGEPRSDVEDAIDLYHLLETEVVPRYYERDADDLPKAWIGMMKKSIATVLPRFSARRMVSEYVEQAYLEH